MFAGHLAGGLGFLSGFVFPFDTTSHGIIGHVRLLKHFSCVLQYLYCVYIGRDRLRESLRTKNQLPLACHDYYWGGATLVPR